MENTIPKKSFFKRVIEICALSFMLIVLPFGTWYYSKTGLDYFKNMSGELHEYGKVPNFSLTDHNGELLSMNDIKGRLQVAGFVSFKDENRAFIASQMQKLYGQFEDRDDVVFLLYNLDAEMTTADDMMSFAQTSGLTDEEQCFLLKGSNEEINAIMSNGYQWPADYGKENKQEAYTMNTGKGDSQYPYFVLADTSMTIRNYYAYDDNKAMGRLVEHLAILMPRQGKGKPVVNREKEK